MYSFFPACLLNEVQHSAVAMQGYGGHMQLNFSALFLNCSFSYRYLSSYLASSVVLLCGPKIQAEIERKREREREQEE
jgi:hypothetical protein